MQRELPMIFSDTIPAIQNTKPGIWPAEPIDQSMPWKWKTRRPISFEEISGVKNMAGNSWEESANYLTFIYVTRRGGLYHPGDIIWVREPWKCAGTNDKDMRALIDYKGDGGMAWVQFTDPERYKQCISKYKIWRPSIFMFREASRITLEIKSVKIEHLCDISDEDIKAEGLKGKDDEKCDKCSIESCHYLPCHKIEFYALWDKLNRKRGFPWDRNPWVYVIEFGRVS